MYCPNCGAQNQTGTKYCKQCGTGLLVVSEALSGTYAPPAVSKEIQGLIKQLHSGRRKTILGGTLTAGGLMIMTLLMFVGMPPMGAFWIVFWMFIWGFIEIAGGLSRWASASGEMKMLGYDRPQRTQDPPLISSGPIARDQSLSGPPVSVTEQTTRKLEDHLKTGDLPPRPGGQGE